MLAPLLRHVTRPQQIGARIVIAYGDADYPFAQHEMADEFTYGCSGCWIILSADQRQIVVGIFSLDVRAALHARRSPAW